MLEQVKDIFLFSEETPLIFTRFYFWAFFFVVLTFYSILYKHKTTRNAYLFLVSLFFYYKTGGLFFFILIFSTVTDFFIGQAIYKSKEPLHKKLWLALSITLNLGVLGFFKYDYFFTETINTVFNSDLPVVTHAAKWSNQLLGTGFDIDKILPPVGISFFTFQTISYSIDVYREKVKPVTNMLDFGFYVSFFPQLVAGPIVRAADFIPQLYQDFKLSRKEFGYALFLILNGLMKKMFVGDYLAVNLIDRVFANPASYSGFENLIALYGYSLQVYCDFSGYTDIAIGLALLMGFRLPQNFNSPYKARNVGEFWKRWHMSLSSWLKDYLYIPMGGNRGGSHFTYISLSVILIFVVLLSGNLWLIPIFLAVIGGIWFLTRVFPSFQLTVSTNINLMMTMLLGGLWHGSSWMFVTWGGLNGLGLLVYKFWKRISPYENKTGWLVHFWKIFITFNFITFTRIWFRGESMQGTYDLMNQVTGNFGWAQLGEMITSYKAPLLMLAFGLVVHWLPTSVKEWYKNWFIETPVYLKVLICVAVVFIIYQSLSAGLQPFIYFQF
ncbi:MAG: MBOAT family protein [Bacteroidetes bacterium]|jgi:D-alanyl-lipoteichoic acid acyltransferase DltB (MBOAT superfamily)|nr:MBOAT family protein [Bacteroidota bacterium]